jgi:hypothetical protein
MRRRYSNKLPYLEYYFEGSIVQDLKALLLTMVKQGKTSIKITARPAADQSRDSDYSILEIVSS